MHQIKTIAVDTGKDYELLDCGDFKKLERFGDFILIRPEPQALWLPAWNEKKWNSMAHVEFKQTSANSGEWIKYKNMPDKWQISYKNSDFEINFRMSLTSFKHVGIFPEQANNWDFIYDQIKQQNKASSVLNLFAYTGGASLAAKAAGADVVHVDSIKQVVGWAKENMELSGLNNIRWTVEDAVKFVQREVKRGKKYQGIILDPPAYGIGANKERWKLESMINDLLTDVNLLLDDNGFLVLNMYSLGLSALIGEQLVRQNFGNKRNIETGEFYLQATSGVILPLGIFIRISAI